MELKIKRCPEPFSVERLPVTVAANSRVALQVVSQPKKDSDITGELHEEIIISVNGTNYVSIVVTGTVAPSAFRKLAGRALRVPVDCVGPTKDSIEGDKKRGRELENEETKNSSKKIKTKSEGVADDAFPIPCSLKRKYDSNESENQPPPAKVFAPYTSPTDIKTHQEREETNLDVFAKTLAKGFNMKRTEALWLHRQEAAFQAWLNAVLYPKPDPSTVEKRRMKVFVLLQAICQNEILPLLDDDRNRLSKLNLRDMSLKDVGQISTAKRVLRSYDPFWLQLAMEITTQKAVDGPMDTMLQSAFFSKLNWLGSAPAKVAECHQHFVKAILKVVLLLDRASELHVEGLPLIFQRSASIKSSTTAVQSFLEGRLDGERDVPRVLGRLGIKVKYNQCPQAEAKTAPIVNLAVDLRDGMKLSALAHLLTGIEIVPRCPADKRPLRIQNVQAALDAFLACGMTNASIRRAARAMKPLSPTDVVDGDREATLGLLWQILESTEMRSLYDIATLRLECDRLSPAQKVSLELQGFSEDSEALLSWVSLVTKKYGVDVRSWKCLGDGQALCMLIHHYMPETVHKESIRSASAEVTAAIDNYLLIAKAGQQLHVPIILSPTDQVLEGADEHILHFYVACWSRKLLEAGARERAAMRIQRWWKRQQTKLPGGARAHLAMWVRSAAIIQQNYRAHVIKRSLERLLVEKRRLEAAVVRLQALWRSHRCVEEYHCIRSAVIVIQSMERGRVVRRALHEAAVIIPLLEACKARRESLLQEKEAHDQMVVAPILHGCVDRRRALIIEREAMRAQRAHEAALRAAYEEEQRQRAIHMVRSRMSQLAETMQEFNARSSAALSIQQAWRRRSAKRALIAVGRAELAAVRVHKEKERQARKVIACWNPVFSARWNFVKMRKMSMLIQRRWRVKYAARVAAAVKLQAMARGFLVRRHRHHAHQAAVKVQSRFRGFLARRACAACLTQIRVRLLEATAIALEHPELSMAARVEAALAHVQSVRHLEAALSSLEILMGATEASRACCALVMHSSARPRLLSVFTTAQSANTQNGYEALRCTLLVLTHVCHSSEVGAQWVFRAPGVLGAIGTILQRHRDRHAVFMAAVSLAAELVVSSRERATAVAHMPEIVAQWEGIVRLLSNRQAADEKYLQRLESDKGSDISARAATQKVVAVSHQLAALHSVLATVLGAPSSQVHADGVDMGPQNLGKNTIVRTALRELGQNTM